MITDLIISAFIGAIEALLSLLPNFTLPQMGEGILYKIGAVLNQMDSILPIGTVVAAIGAALTLRIVLASWDLVVFIYHQFWGSA